MQILTWLIVFVITTLAWWASIKITDRHNSKNSLKSAGGFAFVFTLLSAFMASLGGLGPFAIFATVLWLVGVVNIYIRYYDLGLLQAFATLFLYMVAAVVQAFVAGAVLGALGLTG